MVDSPWIKDGCKIDDIYKPFRRIDKETIKAINAISLKEPITYYSLLTSRDIKPVIVGFTAHVTKFEPNGEIHSTYDRITSVEYDINNPSEYYLLPNATIFMG